jgi:6-phosphogluconolactonase
VGAIKRPLGQMEECMQRLLIGLSVWFLAQAGLARADEDSGRARTRGPSGAVFTISNEAGGNRVLSFGVNADGTLSPLQAFDTQGLGSGDSLGSQGALVLSEDHRFLIAVNPGSNDVSSFAVEGANLSLRDRVSSAGVRPISVTERCGLVYVLNAGGSNNVAGFSLDRRGKLTPISGGTRALSGENPGPAQVELSPDGQLLVVAEKTANKLEVFRVNAFGRLDAAQVNSSAGMTPFGFEFTRRGTLIVSEAASASLSSYAFGQHGELEVLSGAVPDTQMAPCWVAISGDDRYAFTANAGSASISSYAIARGGQIQLTNARAGELGEGGRPLDLALGQGGRTLYALDRGHGAVVPFTLERAGALQPLTAASGLTPFASGLAAY